MLLWVIRQTRVRFLVLMTGMASSTAKVQIHETLNEARGLAAMHIEIIGVLGAGGTCRC